MVLEILTAYLPLKEKEVFIKEHEKRKNSLKLFIERIENKNPVLKSSHLIKAGISKGPNMGVLLKEGEKISINEKIENPDEIILKLEKTNIWPKNP
jgi:hypothetical protein